MTTPRYRVSVDIGGTFTDLVVQDRETGDTSTGKMPSTPRTRRAACSRPQGVRARWTGPIPDPRHHRRPNAVLERKGARVALVTTRDFGDVYAIGHDRRDIYSLHYRKPKA